MSKFLASANSFTEVLLPLPASDFEAILALERGPEFRHSVKDDGRESKANGHVFIILRTRDQAPVVVTFRAKYLTGDNVPDERRAPEGEPALEHTGSLVRAVLNFQALRIVEGEVDTQDDHGTCFDACRIFPISKQQYQKCRQYIAEDCAAGDKKLRYQLAGFRANNCVSYSVKLLERIGIEVPKLWRVVPWPCAISLSLEWTRLKQALCGGKIAHNDVTPPHIRKNAARHTAQATEPSPA